MNTDKKSIIKKINLPNSSYFKDKKHQKDTNPSSILCLNRFNRIRPEVSKYDILISKDNIEKVLADLKNVNGNTKTVAKLIETLFNIKGVELQILIRDKIYYLVVKNTQLDKIVLIKILYVDKYNYVYSSIDKQSGKTNKTYRLQPIQEEELEKFKQFDSERIIQLNDIKKLYTTIENEIGIRINRSDTQQQSTNENSEKIHIETQVTAPNDINSIPIAVEKISQEIPKIYDVKEGDVPNMNLEEIENTHEVINEGDVSNMSLEEITQDVINERNSEMLSGAEISATSETSQEIISNERLTQNQKKQIQRDKRLANNKDFLEKLNHSVLNNNLKEQDIQTILSKFSSFDFNYYYNKYSPFIRNTLSKNKIEDGDLENEIKRMFFCLLIDSRLFHLQSHSLDKSQDTLDSYYDKYLDVFKEFTDWDKDSSPLESLFKELKRKRTQNKKIQRKKAIKDNSSNPDQTKIYSADSDVTTNQEAIKDESTTNKDFSENSGSSLSDIIKSVQYYVDLRNQKLQEMQELRAKITVHQNTILDAQTNIETSEKVIKEAQDNIATSKRIIDAQKEEILTTKQSIKDVSAEITNMNDFLTSIQNIIGERDD